MYLDQRSRTLLAIAFVYTVVLTTQTTLPLAAQTQAPDARPLFAYVGTFSSPLRDTLPTQIDLPPGNGRGIHIYRVDRGNGNLTSVGIHEMGTSPSHLAVNASGTYLYSANETDQVGGDVKQGTVSAFKINRNTGMLEMLNTVASGGAGPTYVSLHPSGQFLLVANYFGGSVAVLPILENGRLGEATDVQVDSGKIGPTRSQNAPPGSFAFSGHDRTHAHMIQSAPNGEFVLHVDLGMDCIFMWRFDREQGKLLPTSNPRVGLPDGDGPRHFTWHPNASWLYSIQEEGSTIARFDFDATNGNLQIKQTISSLPPSYAGSNFCSEILMSPNGKYLLAGNRLHDSIAIFKVGEDGDLSFVDYEWTRGNYPRSFEWSPNQSMLYVCNQRADNVTVFRFDEETGTLEFTEQYVPVGNPSCIVFLDTAARDSDSQ